MLRKMSQRMKTRQERIDELFKKYGLFDEEGYLIPPEHPMIKKYEQRLDILSRKMMLKPDEEREAMELIALDKAYTRELNKYILEQGVIGMDEMSGTSSDDEDFLPEDEYDSDEYDSEEISDDADDDENDEDENENDENDENDDDENDDK